MKKTAKNTAPKAEKKKFRVPLAAKIAGGLVLLLFVALCGFTIISTQCVPGRDRRHDPGRRDEPQRSCG